MEKARKTDLKDSSIITIAGIHLEIWRSKTFENAESAFSRIFKGPYLQRDTGNFNNMYIFSAQFFMGFLMVAFIFN